MKCLSDRYVKVWSHKYFSICCLKSSDPAAGDELGYRIDDPFLSDRLFDSVDDDTDFIDEVVCTWD